MNCSSWGTLQDRILCKQLCGSLLLVQEHRLLATPSRSRKTTIDEARHRLRTRGWASHFTSAGSTTTGSSTGGTAVVWKSWLTTTDWVSIGTRATAVDFRLAGSQCRLVSVYGLDHGTIEDKYLALDSVFLAEEVVNASHILCGGDFNMVAADLSTYLRLSSSPLSALVPTE